MKSPMFKADEAKSAGTRKTTLIEALHRDRSTDPIFRNQSEDTVETSLCRDRRASLNRKRNDNSSHHIVELIVPLCTERMTVMGPRKQRPKRARPRPAQIL